MIGVKYTDADFCCRGELIAQGWLPRIDHIEHCRSGWHWVPRDGGQPLDWAYIGPRALLVLDADGDGDVADGKAVAHTLLIGEEVPHLDAVHRLTAADCAASVLDLADDERCDRAVDVARRYAFGEATDAELAATRKAAWAATTEAAWDAAWDAAREVAREVAWEARNAARSAARNAAWDAAWDAARERWWTYLDAALDGGVDALRAVEPWPRGVRLAASR